MRSSQRWPVVRSVFLAAALAVLAPGVGAPSVARAAGDPQVAALEQLRSLSARPVQVDFHGGTPRTAAFDVPAQGDGPVAQARNFLHTYRDLFLRAADPDGRTGPDVHPDVELRARGVWDADGHTMVGFYQTLGGLRVFAADVVVALRQNPLAGPRVVMAGGSLISAVQRNLDLVPAITAETAATEAGDVLGRVLPPLLGEPELMVYSESTARGSRAVRLVWAVGVGGGAPWQVLVDANTGAVAFKHPLAKDGSGTEDYDLDLEDANGDSIANTNCFNPTTVDDFIGDEDGIIQEYMNDADATNIWWHLRTTYLYYHDHLGRHSWDDDDGEIEVYVHSNFSPNNGQSFPGCGLEFSNGYISLDVTAHEFTHQVIDYSPSQLVYMNQSGALNESFADVLGEMADPDGDWLHREDVLSGIGPNRSLKDPANDLCGPPASPFTCGQPDRMSAFNPTTSDNGGVHINSGIANKASFLMVEGGDFNGISVGSGMGRGKFERLAYDVMRFLPSQAAFTDARNYYVGFANAWAAIGMNSFTADDVCTVRNAWAAVEIGQKDADCDGIEDNVDDSDNDGLLHDDDNCPNTSNPAQEDWDSDGTGDACDPDTDGDGCPNALDKCPLFQAGPCYSYPELDFDGDGQGNACDIDDDGDGVADLWDNCPNDYNPSQSDGNNNGEGDACDPDLDGDGVFASDDLCPFTPDPSNADSDGDGTGDACDRCPETGDSVNAWTTGIPELGIDPMPVQPDHDGDGIPDACDPLAFGDLGVLVDGFPFNPAKPFRPDGTRRSFGLAGTGGRFRIPLAVCGGDDDVILPDQRVQLTLSGLSVDAPLSLWVTDELDRPIARLGGSAGATSALRGLRFVPDCRIRYFLHGLTGPGFSGGTPMLLALDVVPAGDDNPWTQPPAGVEVVPPGPIADGDRDGIGDSRDNCPLAFNPTQADQDGDGAGDACDDCEASACDPREVSIDIRPRKVPNVIRLRSKGVVKTAILSRDGFDATTVDPTAVTLAGAPVRTRRDGSPVTRLTDVDRDGYTDLVLQFRIPDLQLESGDTTAELLGKTVTGRSIHGVNAVLVIP